MMNDFLATLKKTWMKGMEAVSQTASSIAENTKQKVNLMNLENRRKEILDDFAMIAYELWQKGEIFPDALDKQLKELSLVDAELAEYKAKKEAEKETAVLEAPEKEPAEEAAEETEEAPETEEDQPTDPQDKDEN